MKTEKNTIYDVIKDYYFEYQISEDISDVESGYLYLKMKSDIVNKKYDVLQKQFQNEKLFSVNLKILFELVIDFPFVITFTNNIKHTISLFSLEGRKILENKKEDEKYLTYWEILNELIIKNNGIQEEENGYVFLISEEMKLREMKSNMKNAKFFLENYCDIINYDSIIFFIYYIYLSDVSKNDEVYKRLYNDDVIESARYHFNFLNSFVKNYNNSEMYIKDDNLRKLVLNKVKELDIF